MDRNHLQIKEKLGFQEEKNRKGITVKKRINFGLRTPYTTGFTPLTLRASHLNLKNSRLMKF